MKNLIKHKIFIATFLLVISYFLCTISILDLKRDGIGVGLWITVLIIFIIACFGVTIYCRFDWKFYSRRL